jgi:hypothetical protein
LYIQTGVGLDRKVVQRASFKEQVIITLRRPVLQERLGVIGKVIDHQPVMGIISNRYNVTGGNVHTSQLKHGSAARNL